MGTAGKEDDSLLVRALGVQNQGFGAKMLSQVSTLAPLHVIWANLLTTLGLSVLKWNSNRICLVEVMLRGDGLTEVKGMWGSTNFANSNMSYNYFKIKE